MKSPVKYTMCEIHALRDYLTTYIQGDPERLRKELMELHLMEQELIDEAYERWKLDHEKDENPILN